MQPILLKLFSRKKDTPFSVHEKEERDLAALLNTLEDDGFKLEVDVKDDALAKHRDPKEFEPLSPATIDLADKIYQSEGQWAFIYVKDKRVHITSDHFGPMCFCSNRRVSPLSLSTLIENYDELIKNRNCPLLKKLYIESCDAGRPEREALANRLLAQYPDPRRLTRKNHKMRRIS